MWLSTCLFLRCISGGGTHPPTSAAPTSPSRSQNLSATDNTLLFLNDPHPSGEGMRKPPGKVPHAPDAGKEEAGVLCKSLLGKLVPWGHHLALGWASRQRKFSGTGQRGALLGESLGILFQGILWVSSSGFPPDSQSGPNSLEFPGFCGPCPRLQFSSHTQGTLIT